MISSTGKQIILNINLFISIFSLGVKHGPPGLLLQIRWPHLFRDLSSSPRMKSIEQLLKKDVGKVANGLKGLPPCHPLPLLIEPLSQGSKKKRGKNNHYTNILIDSEINTK